MRDKAPFSAITISELTALYRKLESAITGLPEQPNRSTIEGLLAQSEHLGTLSRIVLEQDPPPPTTEAELDALQAAMSEASILLHTRFPQLVPPRVS